jgi:DNA-3-methyladenine glycosylase II
VIRKIEHPKRFRCDDLYLHLLEAIVSQQLSVKAADTIFRRFCDLFPNRYPRPERLVKMPLRRLRNAGLSRQKAGYMRNVAAFAIKYDFSPARLRRMDDAAVIEHLTTIKGVGQWTVEMLLMFPLDRADIFPADDVGIQNQMKKLYSLRGNGRALKKRMAKIAENWRPHRTAACKYLWYWKDSG